MAGCSILSKVQSGLTLTEYWTDGIRKPVRPSNFWGSTRFRGVVLVLLISNRSKCVGLLGVFGLLTGVAFAGGPKANAAKVPQLSSADAQKRLNKASNRFIENVGQWPKKALYEARSENMNVWLTNDGLTFDYFKAKTSGLNPSVKGQVVGMSFEGATSFNPQGSDKLNFVTDYLNAKFKRLRTANSYSGVVAKNIYPGISLHTYYDHSQPRYDLVVAPNADPNKIKLAFKGASGTSIVADTIAIKTQIGTLSQGRLFAYQAVNGRRQQVPANFVALGNSKFSFKLGVYDHSKPLVIDPLVYGSYYGGDSGFDEVRSVATDNAGGVYMTGYTMAKDFPSIFGPYGFQLHGGRDAFVSKLQGDAYSHDYAAIIQGSLNDYGQFIKVDPQGDIWIAGRTQSSDFPGNEVYQRPNVQFLAMTSNPPNAPPTGGTFKVTYGGFINSAALPFNVTDLQMQNAINAMLGTAGVVVKAVPAGATLDQGATYKVSLPWNFPLLLSITSNKMGTKYLVTQRIDGQAVELAATNGTAPSGGTYALIFFLPGGPVTTAPIAYNAAPAVVQAAINAVLGANSVRVLPDNPTATVPPFVIEFVGAPYVGNPPAVGVDNTLLTGGGVYQINACTRYALFWDPTTSAPTGGTFNLFVNGAATVNIPWNANNVAIRTAIANVAGVGANNVVTDVEPVAGVNTLPQKTITITFCGILANTNVLLQINGSRLTPQPVYAPLPKTSDIFVMRFKQSATTVLDPVTTETVKLFGGDSDEFLSGFAIQPKANPGPNDPVIFTFGGTVSPLAYQKLVPITEIPAAFPGGKAGYVVKYTFDTVAKSFAMDAVVPRYVSGGASIDLNGVAMDAQGSVYVGGTCHFQGNVDTAVNPVFKTTAGVYQGGRLLRNDDLFVQKYRPDGTVAYSTLIGGNGFDIAGGLDFDLDGTTFNSGSCIDVDSNLNLYITGIASSFNYPRTRGVYGETFNAFSNVVVTKLNTDASQILYSTNLKTSGLVLPSGVAVDNRGNTFVTGNVHPNFYDFPDTFTQNPVNASDPNQPNSMTLGTIQTTVQGVNGGLETALVPANLQPAGGGSDLATTTGFLNILNSSATTLLYGTYLGGSLDDRVYGPFVDSFGDVWVFGWTDSYRQYALFSSAGTPTVYTDNSSLPAAMISPLAFKATADANGYTTLGGILFGALSETYPNYTPYSWPTTSTPPGSPIPTISVTYRRDGWLDKLRVGLASVASVTFNPSTIPGGLGATTTGTVTLSQGAPTGGANILLTLDSTSAASFSSDPTKPQGTLVLAMASGQTTATFTVYSSAVTVDIAAQVKASYQGSFSIGQFTVTPWLQQFSLTPTSIVGGNAVTGRITLAALPPTGSGGVSVTILTDSPNIVNFNGAATTVITVPEGQASVAFEIDTSGVGTVSFPQITASLLGVGKTQTLTVTLASLLSLTFDNSTVAGGTDVTGTVTLNGQATGPFIVNLTSSDPTFSFDTGNSPTNQLVFKQGDTFKTFTIHTPYKPTSTQTVITANRPAQGNYPDESISNTLFIKASDLTEFTIDPTTVPGGGTSQGTVIIGNAAPAGGVVIKIATSDASVATVPATVTIPAGATSAIFTINTIVIPTDKSAVITASRGPVSISRTLTVTGVSFGISVNPGSVVGGPSGTSTGTITLPAPAPAGGLTFTLNTSDAAVANFGSGPGSGVVTVAAGAKTATFTIFTAPPSTVSEDVTISATLPGGTLGGTGSESTILTVRSVGVLSIAFKPNILSGRAPRNKTICTITLDGPASADGLITLTNSVKSILNVPASVAVKQGATTVSFSCTANIPSRTLSTIVTATFGGASAAAGVVVNR